MLAVRSSPIRRIIPFLIATCHCERSAAIQLRGTLGVGLFLLSLWVCPAFAGLEEFDFFDISFQVLGLTNQPVANAQLRAYSQDWPLSLPGGFAYTDANGICRLRLCRGAWTIVAGGGSPYTDWWSGRGLFLVAPLTVPSNSTLILKPTRQVLLQFYNRHNELSDAYDIYMAPSALVPNCMMPVIGRTSWRPEQKGQCQIEVGAEETLACFLTLGPTPANDGYFVFADHLDPRTNLTIRASELNLRRVHLDGRAATNSSSPGTITWSLCFPELDLPRYWGHTGFALTGAADVYVSAQYLKLCHTVSLPDAGRGDTINYWFYPRGIDLRNQTDATVTVGGPLTRSFHFWPSVFDTTHNYFLLGPARDSFGNELRSYAPQQASTERFRHPISISDPASGSVVYSNTFDVVNDHLEFWIKEPLPASARFRLEWDLGPYGGLQVIEGALADPQFRYAYTTLLSPNFALHLPDWMGDKAGDLLQRWEMAYAYWTEMLGQRPAVWGEQTNFYVDPMGSAGPGTGSWYGQATWYSGFAFWDPKEPSVCPWEAVALHEIGHRLESDLFSPYNCNFSNSNGIRNEAMASLLALDALASLHGVAFAAPHFEWEVALFFDNLARGITNTPDNLLFVVQDYLPRRYGQGITAQFFRSWASACSALYPQGFNEAETFAALYSALAGGNLTWLFALCDFNVSESRVENAMPKLLVIKEAPLSQAVSPGGAARFAITAAGTNLTYQWKKNGQPLPREIRAVLVLSNCQPSSVGMYSVAVSNGLIHVESEPARLSLVGPPILIEQPMSQSALGGDYVLLSVLATGTEPLSYQWFSNQVSIVGATSSTLLVHALPPSGTVEYSVIVSNPEGAQTSSVARLTIMPGSSSLVARFPLDDSRMDTTVIDTRSGILGQFNVSTMVRSTEGVSGRALRFDGVADRIRAIGPDLGNGDFSVSVWIKPNSFQQAGIISQGGYCWERGWLLDFGAVGQGTLRLETGLGGTPNGYVQTTMNAVIPDGYWHHVGVSVPRGGLSRLYVDGQQKAAGVVGAGDLSNTNLVIGGLHGAVCGGFLPFDGQLDDVQIYGRALTEAEVRFLYRNPGSIVADPVSR